jgi:predicted ATPase/DNA-binding CsgD family transcriptional regulator
MVSQKWPVQNESLSKRAVEILHLLDAGLSDREISERLTMTINTVKWYNRQIYSILNVGSRTQAIARARELQLLGEADDEAVPSLNLVRPAVKHNLPVETTRFIGRKAEIEVIKNLLDSTHLLTLVGTPGTGKTRLSLQIGWGVGDAFPDGVYFVPLAPIPDPDLVTNAIASAIDVKESQGQPLIETLKHAVRDRRMLLILDNFEHLLPAATQVSELLSAAPDLKVLATSREPLHLYGEQEYAVPPLELPDLQQLNPETLASCESTALFMQQARAVRSDFELTPENALDVANICVRLEGLPLAIELAAARSKLLSPGALLARLNSRLDTLTGGAQDLPDRQKTLRQTIDWSYNLLNDDEKILFARLTVFRGGCSLEAIEAICAQDLSMDVFDGLTSLVDKSLIQQRESESGEPRFVMLEMLYEYALERLKASDEAQQLYQRHAQYFVELGERAQPELRLAQQQRWFLLLETEYENMRAVLNWSLNGGDVTLGARLTGALHLFWYAYGYHIEGQHWTQRFLEHLDAIAMNAQPKLFFAAGHITLLYDLEKGQHYFEQALNLAREQDDKFHTAWAMILLGYTRMNDPAESSFPMVEAGLALFRELNHKPGIAQALNIVGELARIKGDDDYARRAYEESLVVARETGEKRRIHFLLANLSFLAQHAGDYGRAWELGEQALQLSLEVNNQLDIADVLAGLAGIMAMTNQSERAARLLGAWEAAMEHMGAVSQPTNTPEFVRYIETVRVQLGEAAFQEQWHEGRALSLEQAVALALEPTEK